MASFEKGRKKTGGRVKGTPNKITEKQRNRIDSFFEKHWDEFESEIWEQLSPKDKKDTFVALMNYKYAKLSSVDLKGLLEHSTTSAIDDIRKLVGDSEII